MRIAVLTSSRADYGIYLPLLSELKKREGVEIVLIVFGTHLSKFHGYSIQKIIEDGFQVDHKVESLILGDSEESISNSMGTTISRFSYLWENLKNEIDLIFALGDRFEMFAAVSSSIPFNIPVAHFYGGEVTLGAIDDKFRNAITVFSSIHFTSTDEAAKRIQNISNKSDNIINIGSLSLESLKTIQLFSVEEFEENFNIDITKPTVLVTFHPETISIDKNKDFANELVDVFNELTEEFQIVITMPNADTMGNIIRNKFELAAKDNSRIILIENFGTKGYFTCMNYCSFVLGNSSSGIIETASFGKYVLNLGDRQKGRSQSENTLNSKIKKGEIISKINFIKSNNYSYSGENIYFQENSVNKVLDYLRIK